MSFCDQRHIIRSKLRRIPRRAAILQQKLDQGAQSIQFSKHAMARAEERGIELTDTLMDKLADSVEKAQEKGATNILAFDATQAFIINVPYGRVITTMSQDEMKENIFTNIDGAVIL
ncbi:MAG: TIGR02530 family flagellar biosynthesis protein [Bacillota bacterium]